jgi:cell division septal protein FtsQ
VISFAVSFTTSESFYLSVLFFCNEREKEKEKEKDRERERENEQENKTRRRRRRRRHHRLLRLLLPFLQLVFLVYVVLHLAIEYEEQQ